MKKQLFIISTLLLLSGCGAKQAPKPEIPPYDKFAFAPSTAEVVRSAPDAASSEAERAAVKTTPTATPFTSLSYTDFIALSAAKNGVIIDLRRPEEIAQSSLPEKNMEIDFYGSDFQKKIEALDKETPYFIYCRSGNRSGATLKGMKQLGFTEVYDLKGGISAVPATAL